MKQRRWFQIHLSTALVLMLVAFGLIWLNLQSRPYNKDVVDFQLDGDGTVYGWPIGFYLHFFGNRIYTESILWEKKNLLFDIVLALSILTTSAVVCERFMRRRESAREQETHIQKRCWFQIHLSTAVVLMLVAGGLLWLNLKLRPIDIDKDFERFVKDAGNYGWPRDAVLQLPLVKFNSLVPSRNEEPSRLRWKWDGVANNLVVALTTLGIVAVGCEGFIRRREAAREREKA